MIRSTIAEGRVALIEIESRLGEEVRIRCPWTEIGPITTARGDVVEAHQGEDVVSFKTRRGERYLLAPTTGV